MNQYRIAPGQQVDLTQINADDTGGIADKAEGKAKTAKLLERLSELQELLFATKSRKLLVILQGMDTSGKDGTIRQVVGAFNPQGVRVASFGQPTAEELSHDFLWRVHQRTPAMGEVVVFNRSHYEDVLVVRVHNLVAESIWKNRYDQIRAFEEVLVDSGTIICKFFLHISKEEQKERLEARISDPSKRWKFQHGDLEERKFWDDYQRAYEAVLSRTSTSDAPWYVVPANHKWYRDFVISSILVQALEQLQMKHPQPDLAGIVVD